MNTSQISVYLLAINNTDNKTLQINQPFNQKKSNFHFILFILQCHKTTLSLSKYM